MKKLYWIDDDPTLMKQVANGVFPSLWDKEIASEVLFLGDGYKSDSNIIDLTPKDIRNFTSGLEDLFSEYCYEEDDFDEEGTKYKELKKLGLDIQTVRLVDENNELKEYLKKWKSISSLEGFAEEKLREDVMSEKLMEALKIPDDSYVALDLTLLFGDQGRVEDEHLPILSMELYYRLNKAKCKCFLFSQYTYHDGFKIKWIQTYKNIYGEDVTEIYSRNYLREKKANNATIQELIKMME